MPDHTWTRETPTEAGYYLVRTNWGTVKGVELEPHPVTGRMSLAVSFTRVDNWDCEWMPAPWARMPSTPTKEAPNAR